MPATPSGTLALWGRIVATGLTTLSKGTATVTGISTVTTKMVVLVTPQTTAKGSLYVSLILGGTGFTITSTNSSDACVAGWICVLPGVY